VGISVESAVDVAKESADIILQEKSLLVLDDGVVEGRCVLGNVITPGWRQRTGNVSMVGAGTLRRPPMAPADPRQQPALRRRRPRSGTTIDADCSPAPTVGYRRIGRHMVSIGPSSLFDT
jgi:Mg2+-importing ATPase